MHSTRHAATSAARDLGVNLDQIRRTPRIHSIGSTSISNVNADEDVSFARAVVNGALTPI